MTTGSERTAALPLLAEVFICGCPHSGTSLLANIFAAHPEVYTPLEETYVFKKRPRVADGFDALRRAAHSADRRFLVEKSPRHLRRIAFIRQSVPGARFVIAVRDGRDVVASQVHRSGREKLGPITRMWVSDNTIAATQRGAEDVLVYRHEDLVRDPEGTLKRICAFAQIPFDRALLDYHRQERLWHGQTEVRHGSGVGLEEHNALRNWQVNQPIFDSSGRWKSELSSDDLAPLMRGKGRELMETFGYLPRRRGLMDVMGRLRRLA